MYIDEQDRIRIIDMTNDCINVDSSHLNREQGIQLFFVYISVTCVIIQLTKNN